MFISVTIPFHYTIIDSPTTTDIIEEGVIGTAPNDFTLMSLGSLQGPWNQLDKTNGFVYIPEALSTSIPAFSAHPKMRSKSVPNSIALIDKQIGTHEGRRWNPEAVSTTEQQKMKSTIGEAKIHFQDFVSKYSSVRIKGPEEFMNWVGQQDDLFGFENTTYLSKEHLLAQFGKFYFEQDENIWFGVESVSSSDWAEDPPRWADNIPEGETDYKQWYDQDARGYKSIQRMFADAPYSLKTAKFTPQQTYPLQMKYRYRSDYRDDAQNLRHADAMQKTKGSRAWRARDYDAQYKPPLLDWVGIGYPKIAQTKAQSYIRRKPVLIRLRNSWSAFVKGEGREEMENSFRTSLLSQETMFSPTLYPTDFDALYGDVIPCGGRVDLNAPKISLLSDYSRTYESSNSDQSEIKNYGYAYRGYGYHLDIDMDEGQLTYVHPVPSSEPDGRDRGRSLNLTNYPVYLVKKRGTGGIKPFGVNDNGDKLHEIKTFPAIQGLNVQSTLSYEHSRGSSVLQTNPTEMNRIGMSDIYAINQLSIEEWMANHRIKSEALKKISEIQSMRTSQQNTLTHFLYFFSNLVVNSQAGDEDDDPTWSYTMEDIIYENMLALKLNVVRHGIAVERGDRIKEDEEWYEDEMAEIIVVPHTDSLGCSFFQTGNVMMDITTSNYSGMAFSYCNDIFMADTDFDIPPLTTSLRFGLSADDHTTDPAVIKKVNYKSHAQSADYAHAFLTTETAYGNSYCMIHHERKGFTISDPLTLPFTEKKNKIIAAQSFSYTVPFPSIVRHAYEDTNGNLKSFNLKDSYVEMNNESGWRIGSEITYNPDSHHQAGGRDITDKSFLTYLKQLSQTTYSATASSYKEILNKPPHYVYKILKTNARHLKYARDNMGYKNGQRPKDFTIFNDVLLPWQPHVAGFDEDDEANMVFPYVNLAHSNTASIDTYNYEPKRSRGTMLPTHFKEWIDGVPAEWCPETYSFYGRALGILNWWGSLT